MTSDKTSPTFVLSFFLFLTIWGSSGYFISTAISSIIFSIIYGGIGAIIIGFIVIIVSAIIKERMRKFRR